MHKNWCHLPICERLENINCEEWKEHENTKKLFL